MRKSKLPYGQRAAQRIAAIAHEMGRDSGFEYGWKSAAARDLGITPQLLGKLILGRYVSVGTVTIQRICTHIGCTASDLMEPDGGKYGHYRR